MNPPEIGRVVQSLAGRDISRFFIIVAFGKDGYAEIADGKYHKLGSPKKKKLKHLFLLDDVLSPVADKLKSGLKVYDTELNSALKGYNNGPEI